ncbi:hypothetical protein [Nocardioides dilutus]
MVEVVRTALEPSWAPIDAALALLADVDDHHVLCRARARLRGAAEERMTLCLARALATLNVAIGLLDHEGDVAATNAHAARGGARSAP